MYTVNGDYNSTSMEDNHLVQASLIVGQLCGICAGACRVETARVESHPIEPRQVGDARAKQNALSFDFQLL